MTSNYRNYRNNPVVCTVVWALDLIIFCTVFCRIGVFMRHFCKKLTVFCAIFCKTVVNRAKSCTKNVQVFARLIKKCTGFCSRRLGNPGRSGKCSGLKYKGNSVLPCFGAKTACYQNRYYENRNSLIYKVKQVFLFFTVALKTPAFSIIYISN